MSHTGRNDLPLPSSAYVTDDVPAATTRRVSIKNILVALLLSVLFFLIFCFVSLHGYIAWVLSNPKVAPLYSNPKLSINLEYENIAFPAADGSRIMQGWYIPAEDSVKTIVFSHGYGANREETWIPMYDLANFAHRLNFNVLMFDYGFAAQNSKEVATGGKRKPNSCSERFRLPSSEAARKSSSGASLWEPGPHCKLL